MKDVANTGVAGEELKQFVERIEEMESEKADIAGNIKEIYLELKGRGFDAKAIRQIVRDRKKSREERKEEEAILDLYKTAIGMD